VVGIAESSEDALEKTAKLLPDLILMDIRIGGAMDGIETAAAVRDRFDIPLIYLTAHTDQQTIDRAKMTGASGFLPKPFHHMTLAASIETAIHKHRADLIQKNAADAELQARNRYLALDALTQGLAAGKARYHALVKATSQIIWTMSPTGAPTDAEEEWEAFTGQTGTDLRTEAVHPEDRPRDAAKWKEALRTGIGYEIEKRVRGRDGEYRWMTARLVAVRGDDNSIIEWIGACTDISGRKRAEAEIIRLNETLEDRVAERTAALTKVSHELDQTKAQMQSVLDAASQTLIAKLESALAEKTVLLKEVHHRVKNNLAVVASLLGMQADSIDDERFTLALQKSQQRVSSMALVHEYLYSSDHLDRVNFGKYVQQLSNELCMSHQISGLVTFAIEVEEIDLPVHRAIPCGLILNELFSNALKYAFPDNRSGKITVRFERLPTGELSLSCSDNGVGIPEGFDWQNAPSLGLKIVRVLVNQLKGELTLDRRAGTQFKFKFLDSFSTSTPAIV
jgi:PAS domain S-box-containing protein